MEPKSTETAGEAPAQPASDHVAPNNAPPWEMIQPGRYQPRRIRGSCRGRALG